MNRLKTLVVLSGLIILSFYGHGQTVNYDQALGLPTVTPPSPDAAAIEKFGNIPVSYSTGVPDISIPIWTVQCENMKWPFTLSYHAAGIHVDELASGAGLGWALNGPGVISRAVQGLPDQMSINNVNYDTITYNDWQWLYSALAGHQDVQPDIFCYNFNGRSGKFIVNPDSTILQIPYTDLKIVMNGGFSSFTITDENGVTYLFDQQENTSTSNAQSGKDELYVSSWYLSKVMMPDQKDSITFQFANGGGSTQFFTNFSEGIGQYYPSDPTLITLYGPINLSQTEVQTGFLALTKVNFPNGSITINYASGYRTDIPQANNQISNILINRQTGGVTTPLKNWVFHQSYFFYQPAGTTLTYNDYRLRLDSLYEYGNDPSLAPEVYQFSYNPTPMAPNGSYGQDLWGFNNGHYNNASLLQSTWVYQLDGNNFSVGNANRNPDTVQMQACMLTSIRYPTGGKTYFTYQSNYYPGSPSTTSYYPITETCDAFVDENYSGRTGFRYPQGAQDPQLTVYLSPINEHMRNPSTVALVDITTGTTLYNNYQTSQTTAISTTFSPTTIAYGDSLQLQTNVYPDDSNEVDIRASLVFTYNSDSVVTTVPYGGGLRIATIANYTDSNTLATMENYYYDTATTLTPCNYILQQYSNAVYRWGSQPEGELECSYYFSPVDEVYSSTPIYPIATCMGAPMIYQKVTKVTTDSATGINNGMTVYTYDVVTDEADANVNGFGFTNTPMISNEWECGFLLSQTDYKWQNGVYSIIKQSSNAYYEYKLSQTYGLNVFANVNPSGCSLGPDASTIYQDVGFATVPITTGAKKLIQNTETLYDNNGNSIATVTNNQYNDTTNDFITQTALTDSKGHSQSTTFKYPQDLASPGNVYAKMTQENIIAPVIQQQSFNDSTLMSTIFTNYLDWNGDGKVIAPQIVQASILNNPLENRVQYYGYDSFKNILSVAKVGDAIHSYVWDYRHTAPIAQVTNAVSSDIAYTSFEADGSGGWTIGAGSVDSTTAITGSNSYNLASGSTISASGLNSSTTYIVSYWTENTSSFNIVGTISGYPVQGKSETINGNKWTLYVHKVTGQSSITLNAGGGGHIDELRLYPSTAQMTTYTYSPLVGVTSQTDVGNRVTYYEYDGLQRLKRIRDQDYNILKTYEYQYQAPAGCNGCQSVAMETFLGTNTIGYPVGVFDIHGNLVGNAAGASAYVSLWNSDTADSRVGTLSTGNDSLHFNIVLHTGQTLPASVTGCRYYQVDMAWTNIDAVRPFNGTYIDFGDSTGMRMNPNPSDTPITIAPNTTLNPFYDNAHFINTFYIIHTYTTYGPRTITCYHNDAAEDEDFDNMNNPASSLITLTNLRGNLPANTTYMGGSCYQQPTMTSLANIANWSSIHSIQYFRLNNGDDINPCENISYPQDFLANDRGLLGIQTSWSIRRQGVADTAFKLSRLKSDWNTYFTQLQTVWISEDDWNHENLSGLTNLNSFFLEASTQDDQEDPNSPMVPLDSTEIDNIFIQIAAGAGQTVNNGWIDIVTGGSGPTGNSAFARSFLQNKGWSIFINTTAR